MMSATKTPRLLLLIALILVPVRPLPAEEGGVSGGSGEKGFEWTLSGEARFRPEWRDNADLDSNLDDDNRRGEMRLRLGFLIRIQKRYHIFFQAQDARVAGAETTPVSDEANLDLHQGYVEIFSNNESAVENLVVRVGRTELVYGDQRMLGGFWWNNFGFAFDALRLRFNRPSFWVDGIAAKINTETGAPTAPGFPGPTKGTYLYGVYSHFAPRPVAAYEGYWLQFDNNIETMGELGQGKTQVDAFGFRIMDTISIVDFKLEGVYETGEFAGDDLSAHAAAAVAGVTFEGAAPVRVFGGYDFATGDRNGMDGKREQFFNFFPTNHLHYGYMDYEGWRNIRSYYGGVTVSKGRHAAKAKAHRFALENANGPWQSAAGITLGFDPTGNSGTSVGKELNLIYSYRWMKKAWIEGGYGRFWPGQFARNTRGDDPSDWAYIMLTFQF